MHWTRVGIAALGFAVATISSAAVDPGAARAPRVEFVPPAPGSYQLQRIQLCPEASLLDGQAQSNRLSVLTTGKITLLTFFYTYCRDPWGCPFAYKTLADLRESLMSEPDLARRVRFVSVSFDPGHDTPAVLERYGQQLANDPRLEWRFLTAGSVDQLLPVLESFGQDVSVELDAQGRPTRTVDHMLKLFLIDQHGIVREIYSLAFLQPQVMLNDIRTLAIEERAVQAAVR